MSGAHNGETSHPAESARRLRVDDLAAIVLRNSPGHKRGAMSLLGEGHSGRLFVLAAGVTILLVWGTLYLVFREWRAGYRQRALYGKTQVVATIEPLRALLPPEVDPEAWRVAVDRNSCDAAYGDRLQLA